MAASKCQFTAYFAHIRSFSGNQCAEIYADALTGESAVTFAANFASGIATTPLQNAKHWNFAGSASALFALTFTAEITLVGFELAVKRILVINGRTDQHSL